MKKDVQVLNNKKLQNTYERPKHKGCNFKKIIIKVMASKHVIFCVEVHAFCWICVVLDEEGNLGVLPRMLQLLELSVLVPRMILQVANLFVVVVGKMLHVGDLFVALLGLLLDLSEVILLVSRLT